MTGYIMEHWLTVGVAVFMLGMVLYGHYRGFLRIALSMSALIISLVFVHAAAPVMTSFLKENTQIRTMIQDRLVQAVGPEVSEEEQQSVLPAQQRTLIEQMKLPEQVKTVLLENNNSEIYRLLGVETFLDYVGASLADMLLSLLASLFLFVLAYLGLRLLIRVLDVVARLPVLSGMNQIAGAAAGFFQGLFWIWLLFLFADLFSGAFWAQAVAAQVSESPFLNILYSNNLFSWIFTELLRKIL